MRAESSTIDHEPRSTSRWSVLLIGDCAEDVELFGILLHETGALALACANDLAQGIELATINPPDVVLIDLSVLRGDALEQLGRWREAHSGIASIVLTGPGDEQLAAAAIRAGAHDYLVKGRIDASTLARTISHAIERHRLLDELAQARLRESHSALHDALTGLPNRTLYFDRLAHAINRATRRGERIAVVYLDLHNFKRINDDHGHAAGDSLLTQVAGRLTRGIRRSDAVARLGGDEFAIIFETMLDREMADSLVAGLRALFDDPFVADGHEVSIGFSAGIALCPDDGLDADVLLRVANDVMREPGRDVRDGDV